MRDRTGICTSNGRGTPMDTLGYSAQEKAVLAIARHYFAAFADPDRHGWLNAISAALDVFGHDDGPHAACAVLAGVQTMRRSRQSGFLYNNALCACCSAYVTPHERAFMNTVREMARNRPEAAQGHAVLLCEGNDTSRFLLSARDLSDLCIERVPEDADMEH